MPAARFTLNGGVDGSHDGVPPQQFQLPAEHGERLGFARKIAGGEERDGGTIYLTACNTLGISRANGSVQFDERRGVVLHRLVRDGIPTFHNGALLHEASATLAHSDTIGFGSSNRLAPTAETVTYTADLSSLGRLGTSDAQRMPPPALSRAPAAGASAETRWVYYQPAEGAPAAAHAGEQQQVGAERRRGERGGRKRKRPDGGSSGGEHAAAAPSLADSAEDAVRRERAALVQGMRGEPKRIALRALEMLSAAGC